MVHCLQIQRRACDASRWQTSFHLETAWNHRSLILATMTAASSPCRRLAQGDQAPDEGVAHEQPTPEKPRPEKYDSETGTVEGTKFVLTPYGLGQGQVTHDSTQSFQHGQGNITIARSGASTFSQAAKRTMGSTAASRWTARNTILGFRVKAPTWHSITASARYEGDFEGAPPANPPAAARAASSRGGPFRMRQAICCSKRRPRSSRRSDAAALRLGSDLLSE